MSTSTITMHAVGSAHARLGQGVQRAASNLPQSGAPNIFTIAGGRVAFVEIVGQVTTVIQTLTNASKLQYVPLSGSPVDLCATLDITGLAVGTLVGITVGPGPARPALSRDHRRRPRRAQLRGLGIGAGEVDRALGADRRHGDGDGVVRRATKLIGAMRGGSPALGRRIAPERLAELLKAEAKREAEVSEHGSENSEGKSPCQPMR